MLRSQQLQRSIKTHANRSPKNTNRFFKKTNNRPTESERSDKRELTNSPIFGGFNGTKTNHVLTLVIVGGVFSLHNCTVEKVKLPSDHSRHRWNIHRCMEHQLYGTPALERSPECLEVGSNREKQKQQNSIAQRCRGNPPQPLYWLTPKF